jgi:hypothetical protein
MQDAHVIEWIRERYLALVPDLSERGRRRWAAAEARSLGWGGITAVAAATGMSDRTIRTGLKELDDPDALAPERQRRPGAGRKPCVLVQPGLFGRLAALVEAGARGDPALPPRWTCNSTRALARALKQEGYRVSHTTVHKLLRSQGYHHRTALLPAGDE